ncbi:MAG: hypothetical protein AVDCRST_MAG02-115, partial [uncultured Rubrobacteraceae bacterium]
DRTARAVQGQELRPHRRALPLCGQRGVFEDLRPGRRPEARGVLQRHLQEQSPGDPASQGDAYGPWPKL